ncbi:DinB family protein [Gelidibacter pelagius]|uniref:DinB family protein n=1 Tax=Gelidibacter pelagius TaxID=2819985 RepID=A0ABS3SQE3_9FLAO|nr:DinB family protein [Gelidibacter pelagius]MBO3097925.1 DinB family protein [Gelidibacter pelagius]
METEFNLWNINRKILLEYFENYSLEQLNIIPQGFNNNLIWNIGHVIVVQQALLYNTSTLLGYITDDMINLYKPGTFPTGKTNHAEVNELKELLISLIDKTKTDYSNQLFNSFAPRKTLIGLNMDSIEDAIIFNNYHEGLHLGAMIGIQKFI